MDAVRGWLARLFLLPRRRRNWLFVGLVVAWYAACRIVGLLLDRDNPLYWIAVLVLGWGGLLSLTQIWIAITRGMLFGRLLPLPRDELLRFARQRYWDVETWTSLLPADAVLARLDDLRPEAAAPELVQHLPEALYVRFRRRHQPEPWPRSAPAPRPITIRASVLILLTPQPDGVTSLDAHWDGGTSLLDAMRARARLGRDVVEAARALTTDVDGPVDGPVDNRADAPDGGSAGGGAR